MADNVIREGTKTRGGLTFKLSISRLVYELFILARHALVQARNPRVRAGENATLRVIFRFKTTSPTPPHAVVPVLRSTARGSNAGVDH